MSRTVTFVVKQTDAKKLRVADGTTVRRLRELVASLGYDVIGTDTKIRIVRDGTAIIGHIKDQPLRRNDIVVFENEALRLQVSPEVADTYQEPRAVHQPANSCTPECCTDRVDTIKRGILEALQDLSQKIESL